MNPVRMKCNLTGYEGNTVDLSPRWSRQDTKRLVTSAEDDGETIDQYLSLLREKMAGCHLEIYEQDGTIARVIESGDDLTDDVIDELDEVVIGWLAGLLPTFVGARRNLGNASALVSFSTKDPEAMLAQNKAQPESQQTPS